MATSKRHKMKLKPRDMVTSVSCNLTAMCGNANVLMNMQGVIAMMSIKNLCNGLKYGTITDARGK
jgi:hypothetical protein